MPIIGKNDLQPHFSIQPVHEIAQLSIDHLPLHGFQPVPGPVHGRVVVPFTQEGYLSEEGRGDGLDEFGLVVDVGEHPVERVRRFRLQLPKDRAVFERDC